MLKLANKNIGILGLGKSGMATLDFLHKHGARAIVWDDKEESRNIVKERASVSDSPEEWSKLDYIILSPGIPYLPKPHHLIRHALSNGVKVICDLELFYLAYPNNKYIGVTGTNGKSTTVALVQHILEFNNIASKLVGNIGTPILSVIPSPEDIIVVEASSYQLDLIDKMKFDIAALLNITEDHLDRHLSMENYINAKLNIFKNLDESSTAIVAIDNENALKVADNLEKNKLNLVRVSTKESSDVNFYINHNSIFESEGEFDLKENKSLRGEHNAENIIVAYAISKSLGLRPSEIINAINTFKGLKHRIQFLGASNGLEFINDSKATNAESTQKALQIFENIYWIAGGMPKTGGIESLQNNFSKIKCAFLVGVAADEFAKTLSKYNVPYIISGTIKQAFEDAVKEAEKDQDPKVKTILLSPSCASFDQWKNFEERGDYFINLVDSYTNKL